jgi:hypothetical protein
MVGPGNSPQSREHMERVKMLDLETMTLGGGEIVAFQHSKEESEEESHVRTAATGQFQDALGDIADVVPAALLIAAMSDENVVETPNSDEARSVQNAARKLRELADTFQDAADRIQRARDQQKKTQRALPGRRR